MREVFQRRVAYVRAALNRPIPRFLFWLVTVLSLYDLFLSQALPPEMAKDFPRLWEIIVTIDAHMPSLPPLGWAAIWALFIAGVSIEYAISLRATLPAVDTSKPERQTKATAQPKPVPVESITRPVRPTPRYAPPKESESVDVTKLKNKELGEYCTELSSVIGQMLMRTMRESSAHQLATFQRQYAAIFFWLYEEARRRGHRDDTLDWYYDHPQEINVGQLNQRLKELGNRLPMYYDQ
jgi:hypothetical protein